MTSSLKHDLHFIRRILQRINVSPLHRKWLGIWTLDREPEQIVQSWCNVQNMSVVVKGFYHLLWSCKRASITYSDRWKILLHLTWLNPACRFALNFLLWRFCFRVLRLIKAFIRRQRMKWCGFQNYYFLGKGFAEEWDESQKLTGRFHTFLLNM